MSTIGIRYLRKRWMQRELACACGTARFIFLSCYKYRNVEADNASSITVTKKKEEEGPCMRATTFLC
jgi:hypothetical protein